MHTSCISAVCAVNSSGPATPHTLGLADAACSDEVKKEAQTRANGSKPTWTPASGDDVNEEETRHETPTANGHGYLAILGFLQDCPIP